MTRRTPGRDGRLPCGAPKGSAERAGAGAAAEPATLSRRSRRGRARPRTTSRQPRRPRGGRRGRGGRATLRTLWLDFKATGDAAAARAADPPLLAAGEVRRRSRRRRACRRTSSRPTSSRYGIFGLIDAIEKFDLERAIKFETYAITRIRGAIIDELRAIDWIPRSVRSKAREVEKAYVALENELHRTPTEAEVAEHMGIALDDLHRRSSARSLRQRRWRFDELLGVGGEKGDKLSLVDTLEDTKAEDPVAAFESEETKYLLAEAINTLPEREKIVVTLYYYEGLTLAEIGQVLGVTESRICQMHTKAVLQLRSKLTEPRDDEDRASSSR